MHHSPSVFSLLSCAVSVGLTDTCHMDVLKGIQLETSSTKKAEMVSNTGTPGIGTAEWAASHPWGKWVMGREEDGVHPKYIRDWTGTPPVLMHIDIPHGKYLLRWWLEPARSLRPSFHWFPQSVHSRGCWHPAQEGVCRVKWRISIHAVLEYPTTAAQQGWESPEILESSWFRLKPWPYCLLAVKPPAGLSSFSLLICGVLIMVLTLWKSCGWQCYN